MSAGALELYQDFLNELNKYVEPAAQRRVIYNGGYYFLQSGTRIQLVENDPLFLAIIANIMSRRHERARAREQLELLASIVERLAVVVERLSAGGNKTKKSVQFSLGP